jgi:hypothetical protein
MSKRRWPARGDMVRSEFMSEGCCKGKTSDFETSLEYSSSKSIGIAIPIADSQSISCGFSSLTSQFSRIITTPRSSVSVDQRWYVRQGLGNMDPRRVGVDNPAIKEPCDYRLHLLDSHTVASDASGCVDWSSSR